MLKTSIQQLIQGEDLTTQHCVAAVNAMVNDADSHQVAAFLALLQAKGVTTLEMKGLVDGMRALMTPLAVDDDVLDIVGTGGDGANTVNISTAASLLAASCGVNVVKHGNRAVSSASGSADVLAALGINIDMSNDDIIHSIRQNHFGFCYAPNFHPAMQKIRSIRRVLGVATPFNLLGPLLNPACAKYMILGVADKRYLPLFADVLVALEVKHAWVVHGAGLDELNCLGMADVIEVQDAQQQSLQIDPQQFGLAYCTLADLRGGDANHNAQLIRAVFRGEQSPLADTIVLNAGAGIYISGHAVSIAEGVLIAQNALADGRALQLLECLDG